MKSAPILFLLFQLGKNRYVLEASCIREILPLLEVEEVSSTFTKGAGILNYRGSPVVVLDLFQLLLGEQSSPRLSTRIILVHFPGQPNRLLGLIAERATVIIRRAKEDFVEAGIQLQRASRFGPVLLEADGLIQWVKLENVLTPDLTDQLSLETAGNVP